MVKERVSAKVCEYSLILQLLESPLHHNSSELNPGISSKYSEEVPIRIDSHSVPVQVNQAIIFLMCLFSSHSFI